MYIITAGEKYYPLQGMDDLYTVTDDLDKALSISKGILGRSLIKLDNGYKCRGEWVQVFNLETRTYEFSADAKTYHD